MGTVATLIESARYDLADYEEGLDFDDRILFNFLNRMIVTMDSQLAALGSDLVFATETGINTVASQNYVDLTYMNNTQWDSISQVWIGEDLKYKISIQDMYTKRKWYSSDAEPNFWANIGRQIIWETTADAIHTDLVIHYRKKHRKRLETWSDTFTANATTDALTLASGRPTFVTGDGPFQVSTADTLPAGLSASTDYWLIFDPADTDGIRLADSQSKALNEQEYVSGYTLVVGKTYKILAQESIDYTSYGASANTVGTYFTCNAAGSLSADSDGNDDRVLLTESVDLSTTGSGEHTITMQSDMMPYDGIFDDFIREMMVLHAISKSTGRGTDATSANLFKKRAFEEVIRRGFEPKYYSIDF